MKYIYMVALFSLFIGCGGGKVSSDETFTTKYQKSFIQDSRVNTTNPDRGFYKASYKLNVERDWDAFADVKEKGFQLAYAPILLEDYNDTKTLPDSLLDTIEKNLKEARDAKVKLVFRISYRDSIDGNDPKRSIIEGHFEQLKPLLQKYKDTISIVQAGTIGAWGEWHHFTGEYADSDPDYIANRRAIVTKLLEIFPDKYVQMRTPKLKEETFGTDKNNNSSAKITQADVDSHNLISKIAQHNDCFLYNKTDRGTYPSDNIEFWKSYVENDSYFVPIGGETCGMGDGDEELSSCTNALKEMKQLHYAFLNVDYHPDVIDKWKDEGCYDEINEKLGYSFVATNLEVKESDKHIKVLLDVKNIGFSRAYTDSNITFSLVSEDDTFNYTSNYNIRSLLPNSSHKLEKSIPLSQIKGGSYCLYMKIANNSSSIKLANKELWDSQKDANKLMCGLDF